MRPQTEYLDACGATTHPERRLLLTNHDLGVPLTGCEVQTGLNLSRRARILADIATELPHVRAAVKWATAIAEHGNQGWQPTK